jgi:hypothetical protein
VRLFLGVLLWFLASYLSAALLSSHVHVDPALTDWANVWTYVWLVFAPVVLAVLAGTVIATVGAVAVAILYFLER